MKSTLQRNVAPLIACLGLAVVPMVSHADDGGGDYNFPASNVMHEPVLKTGALSCAEATRLAWFNRAVEISDGDVSPAIPMPAECDRNFVAKADSGDDTNDTK
jgi:hypothetical protein